MMYRIAEKLARKQNALAIVNGESIGQVASQTLESMMTINAVTRMPVIRPVACMDKVEIIDLARKINTYETSIQPWEDCCTIFTPKNPVTKPTIRRAEWMESHFDFEPMVDACVETANLCSSIRTKKKTTRKTCSELRKIMAFPPVHDLCASFHTSSVR